MAKSILTANQTRILDYISGDKFFSNSFYLSGGTALSEFYLHHRLSEDLDFFTNQEIDPIWISTITTKLAKSLKATSEIQRSFNRNLVFFKLKREIIKTEFTYYPVNQIEKTRIITPFSVDSLTDIAVNKFFTIYQKPSARHFIDLYLILTTQGYTWEQIEKLARIKFETHIDPLQLGSQLIKAGDIKDMPKMLIGLPEKDWRNFFVKKAKSLKPKVVK